MYSIDLPCFCRELVAQPPPRPLGLPCPHPLEVPWPMFGFALAIARFEAVGCVLAAVNIVVDCRTPWFPDFLTDGRFLLSVCLLMAGRCCYWPADGRPVRAIRHWSNVGLYPSVWLESGAIRTGFDPFFGCLVGEWEWVGANP